MADLNYRPAAEIEFTQPEPAAPQGDSLRFEQRRESRHHALGSATAFLLDPEHFGVTHGLTLADRSDHGLGAFSAQPLPLGATVTLGFSGFDMFARRGRVVRCEQIGDQQYRLGFELDAALSAA